MKLLLATANPGKAREFRAELEPLGFEVLTLADVGLPQVHESGATFEANARSKAVALAEHSGLWTLADDSGLEVDALGGEPGVRSARYAGEGASDEENNRKLLQALMDVSTEERGAQFRCVLALAAPDGRVWTSEGVCRGRVAETPSGSDGFGYDPIFVPEGCLDTFAQMPREAKARISHRGIALKKMLDILNGLALEGAIPAPGDV